MLVAVLPCLLFMGDVAIPASSRTDAMARDSLQRIGAVEATGLACVRSALRGGDAQGSYARAGLRP